jgi:hypothetical protein
MNISFSGSKPPSRGSGCWLQRGIIFRVLEKVLDNISSFPDQENHGVGGFGNPRQTSGSPRGNF